MIRNILLSITALITTVLFMVSCDEQNTTEESNTSYSHEEAITKAENSPILETELFLGFKIGMTEDEFKAFADSLNTIGKIEKLDYSDSYYYDFPSVKSSINIDIFPEFEQGYLYSIQYVFRDEFLKNIAYIMNAFENSERGKLFTPHTWHDGVVEAFYYIKDNLIVKFYNNDEYSFMIYTNAPTVKKIREREEKEEQDIYNKAKDIF